MEGVKVLSATVTACNVLAEVTAASGVEVQGDTAFIVGDNSVFLYVVDCASMTVRSKVPLAPIPDGTDGADIPKAVKPDFECITTLPSVPGAPAASLRIAAIGSGSKRGKRDGVAIVTVASGGGAGDVPHVAPLQSATALFDALRGDARVVGTAKLNLEGATLVRSDLLVLAHRGNVDGNNSIVSVRASEFEASCRDASLPAPEYGVSLWKLPTLESWDAGVSGVATVDLSAVGLVGEVLLFSASYEATRSEIDDGATLGSVIGIAPASIVPEPGTFTTSVYEPPSVLVRSTDGSVFVGKIEGVALLDATRRADGVVELTVLAVTDPDGDASQYLKVKVEVEVPVKVV